MPPPDVLRKPAILALTDQEFLKDRNQFLLYKDAIFAQEPRGRSGQQFASFSKFGRICAIACSNGLSADIHDPSCPHCGTASESHLRT
jgi:hypothetical protein